MANKQERIATIIRKNIAEIIQFQVKDPHLGFVSIPEVRVSKDFSYATVYVSFFKDEDIEPSLAALNKAYRKYLDPRFSIRAYAADNCPD